HIRSAETERYAEARVLVRAGVDFADLVLVEQRYLHLHGVVLTALGEPLGGVRIQQTALARQAVSTNEDGKYLLSLKVLENTPSLSIRASMAAHKTREISLEGAEFDAEGDIELNIVMEAEATAPLAIVSGTVRGSGGEPVVGQRIYLSSTRAHQRYDTNTDRNGEFAMQGVDVRDDYMLSINAADAYQDYFQKGLRVTKDGLTLAIELKVREVGTLSGQMVNLYGNPVPNFTLTLKTKRRSYYNRRLIGDEAGNFLVERAPVGELLMKTKSSPYFSIEGVMLGADAELHIPVVLDWGYDEIRGQVFNEQNLPVAVPNISLRWVNEQDGTRSTSRRTTAADEFGNFHFTRLGPGGHRLTINAENYKSVRVDHDVAIHGSQIVVKLESK
ncbi:unnamed protein product, partial [marine sediment metagenome]